MTVRRFLVALVLLVVCTSAQAIEIKVFRGNCYDLRDVGMAEDVTTALPAQFAGTPDATQRTNYKSGAIKMLRFDATNANLITACDTWDKCSLAVRLICEDLDTEPTLVRTDLDADGTTILACGGRCGENSRVIFECP